MFWGSSSRRPEYGSSESDMSDKSDVEEAVWTRASRKKKSSSTSGRRYHHPTQKAKPWFWGAFDFNSSPEKPKKRSSKKSRKSKSRKSLSCRPQSSQEWGLLFLTILLFIYLVDFFNLLYRDNGKIPSVNSPRGSIPPSGQQISPGVGISKSELSNTTANRANDAENSPSEKQSTESGPGHLRSNIPNNNGDGQNGDTLSKQKEQSQRGSDGPSSHPVSDDIVEDPEQHNSDLPKNPMNRNMVGLQIPGNTGFLSVAAIKEYYRKLADAYLATFKNGIYRQMYFDILRRRTYSLTPPGANKGVQTMLFQIIDSKVYMMDPYEVPRNSKPFYRTRINQVIWILSKLAGEGRIKNTEFLMAIHDCVQTVNRPHEYRGAHYQESNPAFTIVSCNFSDNIPFPMWEGSKHRDGGFSGWDQTVKKYAEDDVPWKDKQDRAVFRGGNRPSMYFKNKTNADTHCQDVGRTRLQFLSQQQPDVLDVSIGGTCGGVHTHLDRLEPREHHKYKYILYAEGNCMWADRSRTQVFGPSTIIKQETPCGQFFEPLMKPNTHYIPTDFFFTDTVDKVLWARQNDEKAHEIVKNANEFAQNFLTLTGIEAYVEVLLEQYTKLLVEPEIKLENGAMDVTGKKV